MCSISVMLIGSFLNCLHNGKSIRTDSHLYFEVECFIEWWYRKLFLLASVHYPLNIWWYFLAKSIVSFAELKPKERRFSKETEIRENTRLRITQKETKTWKNAIITKRFSEKTRSTKERWGIEIITEKILHSKNQQQKRCRYTEIVS